MQFKQLLFVLVQTDKSHIRTALSSQSS